MAANVCWLQSLPSGPRSLPVTRRGWSSEQNQDSKACWCYVSHWRNIPLSLQLISQRRYLHSHYNRTDLSNHRISQGFFRKCRWLGENCKSWGLGENQNSHDRGTTRSSLELEGEGPHCPIRYSGIARLTEWCLHHHPQHSMPTIRWQIEQEEYVSHIWCLTWFLSLLLELILISLGLCCATIGID